MTKDLDCNTLLQRYIPEGNNRRYNKFAALALNFTNSCLFLLFIFSRTFVLVYLH